MLGQMLASNWRMLDMNQDLYLNHYGNGANLAQIWIYPIPPMRIQVAQPIDHEILKLINKFTSVEAHDFKMIDDGLSDSKIGYGN